MDATVSNYVTWLSNGEADITEAQNIYNDVVADLARPMPAMVNSSSVSTGATGLVALPASAIELLLAFYNNFQLGELSIREANWIFPDWKETLGGAVGTYNYVTEGVSTRSFQVVPIPTTPVNSFVIYSETRQTLPVWLQLPVACLILYHEYRRESDHKEINLSDAFQALGKALLAIAMR